MTLEDLILSRATAGEAYAVAASDLRNAWVELQGHDIALSNKRALGIAPQTFSDEPRIPSHPDFHLSSSPGLPSLSQLSYARHVDLLDGLTD